MASMWSAADDGQSPATAEWRRLAAEHSREVDALLAALQTAAGDPALHAMLVSKLRLSEMTFATRKRRAVHEAVALMQRRAHISVLRRCVHRWSGAKALRERREEAVEERIASMHDRHQRAALRRAVAQWLRRVDEARVRALVELRHGRRLQRRFLAQWHAALSLYHAQLHLAILLHRRQCHGDARSLFAHWRLLIHEAQRRRHCEALLRERLAIDAQRMKRWAFRRWWRWCAREADCRRRVGAVMRSDSRHRCTVRAGLLSSTEQGAGRNL